MGIWVYGYRYRFLIIKYKKIKINQFLNVYEYLNIYIQYNGSYNKISLYLTNSILFVSYLIGGSVIFITTSFKLSRNIEPYN